VSGGLVVLLGAMIVASLLPRYRAENTDGSAGILLALSAYTVLRGAFFAIFNPGEALIFTSAVTLAHLLTIGVLFAASTVPAKRPLLVVLAGLLFITNGAFIIGQ